MSFHKGDTVTRINDLVSFDVKGYRVILIHAGTNDLAELINTQKSQHTTVQQVLERYKLLRSSIRRRNNHAILLFSGILPRDQEFDQFFPYAFGLNFALEKWCAKSNGFCIFLPSYKMFLSYGQPNSCMFSNSDGLHPRGAGKDQLEAYFQQAVTVSSKLERIHSKHTKKLKKLTY